MSPIVVIPGDGTDLATLKDMVLANSFSTTRYGTLVTRWLNDGVMDICRRLDLLKGYAIVSVTDGVAAQADLPFWRLDEVWTADGPAATTEAAFRQQAVRWLDPIPYDSPALAGSSNGTPAWYAVRKVTGVSPFSTLHLTVHPAGASFVAIAGRQRPEPMVDDGDSSGLDYELDDALVAFAKARCFRNEDDFEMSRQWQQDYLNCLGTYNSAPHSGPIVTPGTWEQTSPRSGGF